MDAAKITRMSRMLKAIANEERMLIMSLLLAGPTVQWPQKDVHDTVSGLAQAMRYPPGSGYNCVRRHLGILEFAGLVKGTMGLKNAVSWRVNVPAVNELADLLKEWANVQPAAPAKS